MKKVLRFLLGGLLLILPVATFAQSTTDWNNNYYRYGGMMGYYGNNMMSGFYGASTLWMVLGVILMIALWILVIVAIIALIMWLVDQMKRMGGKKRK